MKLHPILQRKPGYSKSGLRFLFSVLCLICIFTEMLCQLSDSLVHFTGKVSGGYSDIVRQRTNHSSTTIYGKSFDAMISASRGPDTLTLAYLGWYQYASYNNHDSEIAMSANNGLSSLSLKWISSFDWLDYSASIYFPVSCRSLPLNYSAMIRLRPFYEKLSAAVSYERMPVILESGLGLKDFSFSLNKCIVNSSWNLLIQSRPIEFAEGFFSYGRGITTIGNESIGYASPLDWKIQTLSASLKIYPGDKSSAWISWKRKAQDGDLQLKKDGSLFGDLIYGKFIFNNWQIGTENILFSFPLICEYNFYRWVLYGVGHIDSWPFTPLASTVISGQFYYLVNGIIDIHEINNSTEINLKMVEVKPSLGMLYILPDISWRQWAPNYKEFCIMNVKEEPFSIQECLMIRLGCGISFPVLNTIVDIQMEQYLPVLTKEREKQVYNLDLGSSHTFSTADGGRRIRLEIILP